MLSREAGFAITIDRARGALDAFDGQLFVELASRGTLKIELFAPRGVDRQQPHTQDELYVVVEGRGQFACGASRSPFGPGDLLFAPAGTRHRFEDFTDDLCVWVIFYGDEGGEAAKGARLSQAVTTLS